jgi:hypothetical protein
MFTVNDVVFTFTSGVATQTGSNDACSLRQITWSINEKNGVSAGMEMTRKYRIELVWDWSVLHKIRLGLALFGLWWLTPFSTIFQLNRGGKKRLGSVWKYINFIYLHYNNKSLSIQKQYSVYNTL